MQSAQNPSRTYISSDEEQIAIERLRRSAAAFEDDLYCRGISAGVRYVLAVADYGHLRRLERWYYFNTDADWNTIRRVVDVMTGGDGSCREVEDVIRQAGDPDIDERLWVTGFVHGAVNKFNELIHAGDDLCIAENSLLRSLCYPHSRSRLVPHLRINPPDIEAYHSLTVDFIVSNMGTATAYKTFVIVQHPAHFVGVPAVPPNVAMGPRHNPYSISLKGHLHPGLQSLVLRLPFNPPPQSKLENGFSSTVTVFSKDAEPVCWVFTCS
jgi:hypothetical protein